MKRLIVIFAGVAAVGLVAWGAAYVGSRYLVSKLDGTGGVTAPAPGSVTYSSAELGVEFAHPDKYEPVEHKDGTAQRMWHTVVLMPKGYVPPQGGEGPPVVSVAVYANMEDQTIEQWILGDARSNWKLAEQDGGLGSTSVGGRPALAYRHSGLYETSVVATEHNGKIYVFSVQWLTAEDVQRAEFEEMLTTVKFL